MRLADYRSGGSPIEKECRVNNVIPVGDRIVLKVPDSPLTTKGGIILTEDSRDKLRPHEGLVIALGPGRVIDSGKLVNIDENIQVGSRVLYRKYSGSEISLDGDDVVIISESDILCVVKSTAGRVEIGTPEKTKDHALPRMRDVLAEARQQ